jgi:hypothetical protein
VTALRLSEAAWQSRVTDYAALKRWQWMHLRPARTEHGWRTAVSGPLGKGWVDLLLVRGDRLILAELKRDGQNPTVEQRWVLEQLAELGSERVLVTVWRPQDWPEVQRVLA